MASFIYYGVQNRGARKVVTSVHNSWQSVNRPDIMESYPGMTQAQIDQLMTTRHGAHPNRDLDRVIPADGSTPLTPEQRIRVQASQCGAHEVWKFALPEVSTGDIVAFDWQQPVDAQGLFKTVRSGMLAGAVGVSGFLPAGSVLVYWGLNAWVSSQPASPWAG